MNRDPITSLKNAKECLLCQNPMYTVHENENMICDNCQNEMVVNSDESLKKIRHFLNKSCGFSSAVLNSKPS